MADQKKNTDVPSTQDDAGPQLFIAGLLVVLTIAIFVFLNT